MAWSKRFFPKPYVWHSSTDIVRMKWRYYRTGIYTEKKRSHWIKQWPIRKGLGYKKRRVVIGWRCNLDLVETLEQSTNGKFKRFRRSSTSKRILFVCREEDSEIWWKSLPGQRDEMECELERWLGIFSKTWLRIFNISLQEPSLHWPVSTLEFLQPPQTQNQYNWYFGTQGFHGLFKRQTWPRTWQNPFNPIGKWLSRKFNQVHYQMKTSTT